jgi:hypothetical protein
MTERYPGYDVLAKRWSQSWNTQTRTVVDRRLAVANEPRFFTSEEWETLNAVCERILPQPAERPAIPLAAYVDAKIADGHQDGYRHARMPHQAEAWNRGLAAVDREAQDTHGRRFHMLSPAQRDEMLRRMQQGGLICSAWGGMPCELFFEHRLIPDITHAYYAHPAAWNEIGFGGPASPRGYVRMQLDRRDPWEAVETRPGEEEKVRRDNARVG